MFFRDPLKFTQIMEKEQENHQGSIQMVVKNVQNYVNTHGGWTIVGWLHPILHLDKTNQQFSTLHVYSHNFAHFTPPFG